MKKIYKKPSKPCWRKRRNMTRLTNASSPRVRWVKFRKPETKPVGKEPVSSGTTE